MDEGLCFDPIIIIIIICILIILFYRLHEEEKSLRALQPVEPESSPSDAQNRDPTPRPCNNPPDTETETLVERTFGGRLSTAICCLQCHSLSEKEEPFTDLPLAFCPSDGGAASPRQGAVNGGGEGTESPARDDQAVENPPTGPVLSLEHLLKYFLSPEILEEENRYFCERCGSLQRAERVMRVVSAPEYLVLTLLRFSYDATCHVRRKILDNVGIPQHMSLPVHQHIRSSCSSSSSGPTESGENLAKKLKPSHREKDADDDTVDDALLTRNDGSDVPYVLSSVVMHSGMSSESGHYYSYGRDVSRTEGTAEGPDCGVRDSRDSRGSRGSADWYLFNDSRVTFADFQSVQNISSRFPKDTAYILVYRKKEPGGQCGGAPTSINGMRLSGEPPLHKDLMEAITRDNKLFLQVRKVPL